MDVMTAINTRRSVRHYTARTVEKEVIERLLSAAVQAPSASNKQPWAFAVISDSELMTRYSDQAKRYLLGREAQTPWVAKYKPMLSDEKFNIFYNAGTLVIIYAKPSSPQAPGDCCLAAQNLMLAAHELGLGTCWIGLSTPLLDLPETKAELGVPKEYIVVAPIIVGYHQGKIPHLARKEPEIIFWR